MRGLPAHQASAPASVAPRLPAQNWPGGQRGTRRIGWQVHCQIVPVHVAGPKRPSTGPRTVSANDHGPDAADDVCPRGRQRLSGPSAARTQAGRPFASARPGRPVPWGDADGSCVLEVVQQACLLDARTHLVHGDQQARPDVRVTASLRRLRVRGESAVHQGQGAQLTVVQRRAAPTPEAVDVSPGRSPTRSTGPDQCRGVSRVMVRPRFQVS